MRRSSAQTWAATSVPNGFCQAAMGASCVTSPMRHKPSTASAGGLTRGAGPPTAAPCGTPVSSIFISCDVPTGEAHLVHRGDGWLYTVGFSPDDTKLLIGKAYSSFNQELWLLDLSNGAACYLTPHLGNARYEAVFAPDGHRLYFASDLNRDFLTLTHMDLYYFRHGQSCPTARLSWRPRLGCLLAVRCSANESASLSGQRRWLYTAYHRVAIRWCRAPYRGLAAASRRGVRRPREGPRVAGTHLADKPRAPY